MARPRRRTNAPPPEPVPDRAPRGRGLRRRERAGVRRATLFALPLLVVGVALCVALWGPFASVGISPVAQGLIVLAAAGLAVVPAVSGAVGQALERVRHPSPQARRRVAVCVCVVATLYLAATAYFHARDLFPRIHDECSYTIGARMLARGHLWTAEHPQADFFESFHLLVRPKYCSIYFPGTALMLVPGVWLGLPSWVVPVLLAGAVVGLTYRVTAEMVDGVAGLLAALLVLSTGRFRTFSTMAMAQVPSALLGLLVVWAYLRWRRERRTAWAAAVGAFAGWAAVTRPVDALAFAVPVGLAMAWDLLRRREAGAEERDGRPTSGPARSSWAERGRTAGVVLAGATPFLLLQVAFNVGVTGRPLYSPYVLYLDQNQPGSVFGTGGSAATAAATRPASALPQKQVYYEGLLANEADRRKAGPAAWLWARVAQTSINTLPSPLLLVPLPVALLALGNRRRWAAGAAVPLFVGLYLLNPFYLAHYSVPLAPAAALLAVVGMAATAAAAPGPRLRRGLGAFLVLAVVGGCLVALPEFNPAPNATDEPYRTPLLGIVEQKLADVPTPAVVLFRYNPDAPYPAGDPHQEPVYNTDVAWPDDAPIVRAHDLGPARDEDLFRYYGRKQPTRTFYLFDRQDGSLTELGPADRAGGRLRELYVAKGYMKP